MFGGSFGNHNTQVNNVSRECVCEIKICCRAACLKKWITLRYIIYFMQPQAFLHHLLIYNVGRAVLSKTVLTRIISIVRVPSLWFNKDTHNNSDDELKCFSLSVKLVRDRGSQNLVSTLMNVPICPSVAIWRRKAPTEEFFSQQMKSWMFEDWNHHISHLKFFIFFSSFFPHVMLGDCDSHTFFSNKTKGKSSHDFVEKW